MFHCFFKKTYCPISECLLRHTVYPEIQKSEIIAKCVLNFRNYEASIVQSVLNIRNTVQKKNVNLDVNVFYVTVFYVTHCKCDVEDRIINAFKYRQYRQTMIMFDVKKYKK